MIDDVLSKFYLRCDEQIEIMQKVLNISKNDHLRKNIDIIKYLSNMSKYLEYEQDCNVNKQKRRKSK